MVDMVEGIFGGEGHVEHGEERDKAGVDLVTAPSRLPHGRHVADVLQLLPVQVLAAIEDAAPLQ